MTLRARIASALAIASALLVLVALLPLPQAAAQSQAERGRLLAETCLGCHGIAGYYNAYPNYKVPKLGGQNAEYIVVALQSYKNGERAHDTMHSQAATLSDADMQALAAWFAQGGEPAVTPPAVPSQVQTCAACHGNDGMSTTPQYPNLGGQHADYLAHSLQAYRDGGRKNAVMAGLAAPLTDQDIELLSRYFGSLRGLQTLEH